MNSETWKAKIAKLPPGLTLKDAAKQLRKPYAIARHWLQKLKYAHKDGRSDPRTESWLRQIRKTNPKHIDWRLPNVEIARKHGISRQRVFQLRQTYSKIVRLGRS